MALCLAWAGRAGGSISDMYDIWGNVDIMYEQGFCSSRSRTLRVLAGGQDIDL